MTDARPTTMPRETGITGRGHPIIRTPGTLLRQFFTNTAPPATARIPAHLPDQAWLVTYEDRFGEVVTQSVLINGANLMADTETLVRIALKSQRDIEAAQVLRIQLDLRAG